MAGINSVGTSNTHRASFCGTPGLNESELAKNLKLIETTVNQAIAQIDAALGQVGMSDKDVAKSTFETVQKMMADSPGSSGGCFPCEKPNWNDCFRPKDKLKVDSNGKITTPGGYQIEQLGQFEWKISGPDGKSTRVWGDPHVEESDGGKFDFKRNTTFVLGDGTEIHVTTKPWGNGNMTVTGQLDITCGDDHIQVTDIDKGKGKVGQIKKDGYEFDADFTSKHYGDTLKMGAETDDWSFLGHEVIGDNNGGESFKTGNRMMHGGHAIPGSAPEKNDAPTKADTENVPQPPRRRPTADARDQALTKLLDSLTRFFDKLTNPRGNGFNSFRRADDTFNYDRRQHRDGIGHALNAVRYMFRALDEINKLSDMVNRRNNVFF